MSQHLPAMFVAMVYFAVCQLDPSRPYTHDSATTVHFNIADQPWSNALGGRAIYTNHPLASVIGQVVWRLGGTTELWQRVPSALAASALVALVFGFVRSRFGTSAAVSAVLVVGLNPLFLHAARTVRGYALTMLFVSLGTILLLRLVDHQRQATVPPKQLVVAYSLAMGLGIGSHAYSGMVLLCHIGFLVAIRSEPRDWIKRIGWSLLIGGVLYASLLPSLIRGRGRAFRPDFPYSLARELGGGHWAIGLLISGLFLAWLVSVWRQEEFRYPAFVVFGIVALQWLVLAPADLFPRFFISFLPAVAIGVALQVRRWGWPATTVVGFAMALSVASSWSFLTRHLESRELASLAELVSAEDRKMCALSWTGFGILPYTDKLALVEEGRDALECDVVVTYEGTGDKLLVALESELPNRARLVDGSIYIIAWSDGVHAEVEALRSGLSEPPS